MREMVSLDYFGGSSPISVDVLPDPMKQHWETISGYSSSELDAEFWAAYYEFVVLAFHSRFRPPVSKWALTFRELGFSHPGTLATMFHHCYSTLKACEKMEDQVRDRDVSS